MAETRYPRWIWKVTVLLIALCEVGAIPSNRGGYSGTPRKRPYNKHRYEDYKYEGDKCGSDQLICVPKKECPYKDGECPVNFHPVRNSYCVFRSKYGVVEERTQYQVVEYCKLLGARPYYFQSADEWEYFLYLVTTGDLALAHKQVYWLDAFWEVDEDRWEWRSTTHQIDWEKILNGTSCQDENYEVTKVQKGCLGFSSEYEGGKKCLRLHSVDCNTPYPFLCKIGLYDSQCAKNSDTACCHSPTYDYLSLLSGPGSHSVQDTARSDCWIKFKYYESPKECQEALRIVGNLAPYPQPVLVGSSYFYFSEEECKGERRAVVSSRAVHDFIFRYLLTIELSTEHKKYLLGIRYDDRKDEFYWENDEILTFYSDTKDSQNKEHGYNTEDGLLFWAPGQPDKRSRVDSQSCVGYMEVLRNDYKWYLTPSKGCSGPYVVNICELPIRSVVHSVKKEKCGQRMELGVLARSYSPYGHYDAEFNEAQYGEFGWHVAVMKPSNVQSGVAVKFACSGALVHEKFVLTSAHCVESTDGVFQVSLGAYNLKKDAVTVLDSKLVKVIDVIIHPGYDSKNAVHDIALLHLESRYVTSSPHVGLGCLPYPKLFYQSAGFWDCLTVGWPAEPREEWILQRIESDFVPRRYCQQIVRSYPSIRRHNYLPGAYNKESGFHHSNYEQHKYFSYSDTDLLCTEPYETKSCLDEPTPILVCRRAYVSPYDSFLSGSSGNGYHDHHDHTPHTIINAYGEHRFDGDEWYVMGVGHRSTPCGEDYFDRRNKHKRYIQVFTPVNEYLSFLHSHMDHYEDHYEDNY